MSAITIDDSDDPLDDICAICGEVIKDRDEWTLLGEETIAPGSMAHLNCVDLQ